MRLPASFATEEEARTYIDDVMSSTDPPLSRVRATVRLVRARPVRRHVPLSRLRRCGLPIHLQGRTSTQAGDQRVALLWQTDRQRDDGHAPRLFDCCIASTQVETRVGAPQTSARPERRGRNRLRTVVPLKRRPAVSSGFPRADEGTRTLDLLHGKYAGTVPEGSETTWLSQTDFPPTPTVSHHFP